MDSDIENQRIVAAAKLIMETIIFPEMLKVPSLIKGCSTPFREQVGPGTQICRCTKHNMNICTYNVIFAVGNDNGHLGVESRAECILGMRVDGNKKQTLYQGDEHFDIDDAGSQKVAGWVEAQIAACAKEIERHERFS